MGGQAAGPRCLNPLYQHHSRTRTPCVRTIRAGNSLGHGVSSGGGSCAASSLASRQRDCRGAAGMEPSVHGWTALVSFQSAPHHSLGWGVRSEPLPQRKSLAGQYRSQPQHRRSGCAGLVGNFLVMRPSLPRAEVAPRSMWVHSRTSDALSAASETVAWPGSKKALSAKAHKAFSQHRLVQAGGCIRRWSVRQG